MTPEEVLKINQIGDFFYKAFCVNGEVKFIKTTQLTNNPDCEGLLFEVTDHKRGLFYVAIYHPTN